MSSDFPDPDFSKQVPSSLEPVSAEFATEASTVAEPSATDDLEKLSFLHPMSLLFELVSQIRSYLVPAALGLFGAAKGDIVFIIISAVIFIPAFLTCVIRYFTFRYCIKDDHLVVRQGMIFKSVRTIPVDRIQNIDFVQNPLHRVFRVAEVKIETASGTKPEATMRVLSMAQMAELRRSVFDRKATADSLESVAVASQELGATGAPGLGSNYGSLSGGSIAGVGVDAADGHAGLVNANEEAETLLKIPLSWLVRAGLASNRGMIMVGVLLGLYFQFGGDQTELNLAWLRSLLPAGMSTLWIAAATIIGSILALAFFRILGIAWYILRFFDYKLVRRGEDLRISCGLFTKVSATIPRKRIQFISIQRNLILSWLGFASIRIETAGGATNSQQDATEAVSKRWFIPVIPAAQVPEMLASLRPGVVWDESKLVFQPMADKTGWRLCRLAVMYSLVIAAIGLWFLRPWGWVAGAVALPFLLAWAFKKARAMSYSRTESIVVYRSGVFVKKTSLTFFEKIQTLSVHQSPFDRIWKMARLRVDTAAAGQAEHLISAPYLDEDFAQSEFQFLRVKTGQEQPVFG